MTPSDPLKSLRITAFRGATSAFILPFEKGRKLTLVYGENGTGKTTISDAFEFLVHERVSSLDGYGLGKRLERYWPSVGKTADDLSITLETNAGTCSGRVINNRVSVTPPASRPRIELLRRQQILALIQAQPKERYDAIKRFIDIANFEASEEALRQQGRAVEEERSRAQQAEGQSLQELQGFYDTAGAPKGLNAVTWAKQKLAEPTTDLDAEISAIGRLRSAYNKLKSFPDRMKNSQAMLENATHALKAAEDALAEAAAAVADGSADTLGILEAGREYLHAHPDPTECPLCRSTERVEGLVDDIEARLSLLGALRKATAARQQQATQLTQAQNSANQFKADYEVAAKEFTAALNNHSWKAKIELPVDALPDDPTSVAAWLGTNDAISESWPGTEACWRDERKFIQTLRAASERYDQNLAKREELDALVPKLSQALKLCIEQRQAFTSKIIAEIAQEVGRLYEQVHPGEGLEKIALLLDPKKRASIELEAKFSGKDVPPQAYFSQSHLDTLGLCVFLALAGRDRSDETILILDDVLGSVDEPHVERVVNMIYEASDLFRHTIVTTHYRPWRERFRWGALKPGRPCQFVELSAWDMENGMSMVGSVPEIDRLKSLLAQKPPDTQAICSKAGVLLEYALDYLTQRYECSVPRRHGYSFTIGDLLPAVSSKLRDALKVEVRDGVTDPAAPPVSIIPLGPILDELTRIAQVRNAMGAHFKEISFDLLDSDADDFANQVVLLIDALSHPEDGWPNNDKSGSYWRNSGNSRRLHPLKKPS